MPIALFALAIASFGIGTTEFVIMGLLPEVAADLGVSIPSAGLLITGYAIGVVVGGPIIVVATSRLPRKLTLVGLAALFVLGNLFCAIAPTYGLLMAARVFTAFGHGAFFGISAVVAGTLVPRNQRARAMALVFAGLTLANILGVPGGTALGQVAGWRATFWAVVAIGLVSVAAILAWVPSDRGAMAPPSLVKEFAVFKRLQVWLAMAISVLAAGATFACFTYIAPILQQVTGMAPHQVTWALLLFGVGITIGNLIGGRLADWKLMPTILGALTVLILVMAQFSWTSHSFIGASVSVFVWGCVMFILIAPLQMRVIECAGEAPNLASTLNQGAFNVGNAGGAWIGGLAITFGAPYDMLPLVGAGLSALALGVALLSSWLAKRQPGIVTQAA
ncbi:MFS transporter [Kaistia sp. 32K]|uniref:MFS transporter n=1 Tax=Kaistia sp. 32K TaxID=2795690 RepID=UPI001916B561|nr:MFS transporter [Kaistia sp. 32K]BCP54638.1 MFS transporter [Kaistia sp. 32K]